MVFDCIKISVDKIFLFIIFLRFVMKNTKDKFYEREYIKCFNEIVCACFGRNKQGRKL